MNIIGYIAEYYTDNQFIGYLSHDYKGEIIGYEGKQFFIADTDIQIKKKKINKGQKYFRIIYALQGKLTK
jgi:hypothetical protein